MTLHAVIAVCRTMHFLYVLAPRPLMKTIDILCDYSVKLAGFFHLSKLIVCSVRLNAGSVELLPVELIENFRMVDKAVYAQKIFRTVSVELDIVLVIKSVFASEVGNSALGRSDDGDQQTVRTGYPLLFEPQGDKGSR